MSLKYPEAWSALECPQERFELLDYLDELARPERTAKWLEPPPHNLVIGIDQMFHFFFDDHEFDEGSIGYSLFDERELVAVRLVKNAIDAILKTNNRGDDAYFLNHPNWRHVEKAAANAHRLLVEKGDAWFE